jgi:hypothetical protein
VTERQRITFSVPRPAFFAGIGTIAAALMLGLAALLMWGTASGGPAISEEQAIAAAVDQVEADGVMTLDGRETVAEQENGDWHVYFPLSLLPQVLWGDIDCSDEAEPGDALELLAQLAEVAEGEGGCPDVGSVVDPAAICVNPGCANITRGGEPHVIIDGDDGSVVDVYYTQ